MAAWVLVTPWYLEAPIARMFDTLGEAPRPTRRRGCVEGTPEATGSRSRYSGRVGDLDDSEFTLPWGGDDALLGLDFT